MYTETMSGQAVKYRMMQFEKPDEQSRVEGCSHVLDLLCRVISMKSTLVNKLGKLSETLLNITH